MPFFPCAHAGHPLWQYATKQVIVQLQAQVSMQNLEAQTPLGVVYVSAMYAEHARDIVAMLAQALPDVRHWVGSAAHAVLAGDMDYGSSGALAVMLPLVDMHDYQVFSGIVPWQASQFTPQVALIHGDASSPRLAHQVQTFSQQLAGAHLMGGLCHLHAQHAQWSWGVNAMGSMPLSIGGGGVQVGGFSGVAFGPQMDCLVVEMQGCKPTGPSGVITQVDGDVVLELDGKPALEVFFNDVNWSDVLAQRSPAADVVWAKLQQSLMAMQPAGLVSSSECLSVQSQVLRVVGIDPLRQGIVLDGMPVEGRELVLCQSDEPAMRADMRRACAELWESLTEVLTCAAPDMETAAPHGRCIGGAIYIRNQHRHAQVRTPHIDAELQLIRHALGPIPLLGFSSSYEVNERHLQHMSAQLLVFTQPLQALT